MTQINRYSPSIPRPSERWTHVHEPAPTHLDEIPDDNSDVFEAVAAEEEHSLEFFSRNIAGKRIMKQIETNPTALAQALEASGVVHMVNNYFDPTDVLNEKLRLYPVLHSRVMTSMAWMLDMAVVNTARQVLFTRYSELEQTGEEAWNDFHHQFIEDLSHPSLYIQEGSNEQTLAQLIALRPLWHELAGQASAAADRDYNPKTLEEQLLAEKPRKTSIQARMNLDILAAKEARGDDAKRQRLVATLVARDEVQAMERVKGNKKQIGTIMGIIGTAFRFAEFETRFDHLPMRNQKFFTVQAVNAIERSQADIAKLSRITSLEFVRIVDAAFDTTEVLNKVLREKYSEVYELESTGTHAIIPQRVTDFNRRHKEIAAHSK